MVVRGTRQRGNMRLQCEMTIKDGNIIFDRECLFFVD